MGAHTCQYGTEHKMCRCPKEHKITCPTPDQCKPKDDPVTHNHMTRDIKPEGECPACDQYHASFVESTGPKCSDCGRARTIQDAYDYSPLQIVSGQPLGWYSGDDGEFCPQCLGRLMGR